jgi:hypothetical protein
VYFVLNPLVSQALDISSKIILLTNSRRSR